MSKAQMPDLELIDIHTHAFSTPEMGIGWQHLVGVKDPSRPGTADELLGIMKKGGISRSVMLMYTPTRFIYESRIRENPLPSDLREQEKAERELKSQVVQQMVQNNEWACRESKKHPELIAFAGLDPVYMDERSLLNEIDDKVKKGAKGVKIAPRALAIYANDKRLLPVYDKIGRMRIPLVSQAGGKGENGKDPWGRPMYFAEALAQFPDLTVNLAHLGDGYEDDIIELCKRFPNFYADLSLRLHELDHPGRFTTQGLVEFIHKCGPEHITFGTNYPIVDPVFYAEVLRELPLTSKEKEAIGSGNAKRILGIK